MSENTSQQPQTRQEVELKLIAKAWQDEAFKQELISNPKAVFAREFGQPIPENIDIRVVEETPNAVYLVLPMKPTDMEGEGELSEEALEAVAGGGGGFIKFSSRRGGDSYWIAGSC